MNPILKKLLIELGKDTKATWNSIKKADGSVQHLEFLTDEQKELCTSVFPNSTIVDFL